MRWMEVIYSSGQHILAKKILDALRGAFVRVVVKENRKEAHPYASTLITSSGTQF